MFFLLVYLLELFKLNNFLNSFFLKNNSFFWYYLTKKQKIGRFLKKTNKCVYILKTDSIGDYVIFRPFLSVIKSSFPRYKLILIGNIQWKQLAEHLDSEFIDEFIWIDKKKINFKFLNLYTIKFLLKITSHRHKISLYPVYSREFIYGDLIMSFLPSQKKISYFGDNINKKTIKNSDKIYDKILCVYQNHDFDKHKEFFEKILLRKIENFEVITDLSKIKNKSDVITVCPGSSQAHKMWPNLNWIQTINYLLENHSKYNINILGGNELFDLSILIDEKFKHNHKVNNLIGKTTLTDVIHLIDKSKLLITVDSMSVHIGYQCKIPTICIYKANHYGRFLPYVNTLNFKICIPKEIEKLSQDKRKILFEQNEGLNIELITLDYFISDFKCFVKNIL